MKKTSRIRISTLVFAWAIFFSASEGNTATDQISKFRELQIMAIPLKTAVELAVLTRNPNSLTDLNGGALGIPRNIYPSTTTHGKRVEDGIISITWRSDGSSLDGHTFTLTPNDFSHPVEWTEGGTCFQTGICYSIFQKNPDWI